MKLFTILRKKIMDIKQKKDTMANEKDNKVWFFIVVPVLFVVVTWIFWLFNTYDNKEQFGDIDFGALEALFTGLAFAFFIYTIWIQRKELNLQREELKLQRDELVNTRKEFEVNRITNIIYKQIELIENKINNIKLDYDKTGRNPLYKELNEIIGEAYGHGLLKISAINGSFNFKVYNVDEKPQLSEFLKNVLKRNIVIFNDLMKNFQVLLLVENEIVNQSTFEDIIKRELNRIFIMNVNNNLKTFISFYLGFLLSDYYQTLKADEYKAFKDFDALVKENTKLYMEIENYSKEDELSNK